MRRLAFHEVMGVLGIGDLHPGGRVATDFLLEELAKIRPRVVLEIGAGIGRTTERMVGRGWHVVPIEPNDVLRRELEAKLPIHVHPNGLETFAGGEGRFDAVIGESAFYGMNLPAAFGKVHRLLRPGGLLASVDMVWTDLADPEVAARVHDETRETFGIPMASRERLTWSDWKTLLNHTGFVQVIERKFQGNAWRVRKRDRRITMASALRHPLAFAQHLKYRHLSRTSRVPPDWLETWIAVWRRS
jgi:SAM-dependent methyltransferase